MSRLLSIDWDFFAGAREHVFDSPLWGSPDLAFDRLERWRERARSRGGTGLEGSGFEGSGFEVLRNDFPLFGNPRELLRFAGVPTFAVVSHDAAYGLLEDLECSGVINFDSHHDLFSSSGDPKRLRPGNWAGLALERGLIESYACIYPAWHAGVRVGEGFDLERTWSEIGARAFRDRVCLSSEALGSDHLGLDRLGLDFLGLNHLGPDSIRAIVLVLSPSWSNPLYDSLFFEIAHGLDAKIQTGLVDRTWSHHAEPCR